MYIRAKLRERAHELQAQISNVCTIFRALKESI